MAEHKKLLDQQKKGAPGSKEEEVFHLQQAMEERNERNVRPADSRRGVESDRDKCVSKSILCFSMPTEVGVERLFPDEVCAPST